MYLGPKRKRAIAHLGTTPDEVVAYARTFDEVGEDGIVRGSGAPLGMSEAELDEALSLIAEAEDADLPLTRAKLRELSELIRSMKN